MSPPSRPSTTTVLVVDADPHSQDELGNALSSAGYRVDKATDDETCSRAVTDAEPHVVVADVDGFGGADAVAALRGRSNVPIIVLSARAGHHDKMETFEAGADDYLTRPFEMDELMARVRALVRRRSLSGQAYAEPAVETDSFTVDLFAKKVHKNGTAVHLTPNEWGVLEVLARNPGRLIPHRHLLEQVWGPGHLTHSNYLRVYIAQLRRKLEPVPARPRHLLTEPGAGYRFES
ncbi:winged helix-turn-helix domain-containing protein [Amycolatopsis sp. cg5]|uniref:winged helix-turn-helix domain-containing protein n=1 Tax=Amycolatopsis sp. cg5 TaxID=3238802 RepID=UPI0035244E0E